MENQANQPQPKKPANPALWIVLIIVILVVAGYGVYAYMTGNTNTNTANTVVTTNQNTNATANTNTATNTNIDTSGWQVYTNEKWGVTVKYPSNVDVIEKIDKGYIEFRGPEQKPNGGYWPRFGITHHDTDYYNPPVGTDVSSWVQVNESYYTKLGTPYTIANLKTVHILSLATPQANGADIYYVISGTKLSQILVSHDLFLENQPIDYAFLESISFNN